MMRRRGTTRTRRRELSAQEKKLSLAEHVDELRGRVFRSVVALALASVAIYRYVDIIVPHLLRPVGQVVFLAPHEAFVTGIKIAFFGGLLVSSPVILYQLWGFVAAGLRPKERKYALIFGPVSLALFLVGSSFAYFIIAPIGVRFLLAFATDDLVPMISISNYISFVGTLILAFGAIFELPLVLLFLTKIGLVTPEFLARKRKHAVVLIFLMAAMLTPPDVVTQCMMAVPLLLLYEAGLALSRFGSSKGGDEEWIGETTE